VDGFYSNDQQSGLGNFRYCKHRAGDSQALRENREQPIPLEDAVNNMAVIDAILRSVEQFQPQRH